MTVSDPQLISPTELADGAAAHPLLGSDAALVDPILFVNCDAPYNADSVRAASASPRILIGLASGPSPSALAETLALTLVPSAADTNERSRPDAFATAEVEVANVRSAATALAAAVHMNPQAATVLTALLRAPHPGGRAALDAESLAYSTLLGGAEFRRWLHATRRPTPAAYAAEPVLLRREETPAGDVLRLTLNRPERRNAFGFQLRDALVAGLDVARVLACAAGPHHQHRPPLRVLLDGAGPSFCSGGDLAEFGTATDLATAHLIRTHGGAALPMMELADHIEARMHGPCVGAGVELPAFARRVLAAPGTTFRLPEIGMGLIPGAGGTVSLPRRIGRWRTLYLALSGAELDLDTALTWRLIDEVTRTDQSP